MTEPTPIPTVEIGSTPRQFDPISRKLVGGLGLGGALTVVIGALLQHLCGYTMTVDEAAAVNTLISAAIGWWIDEIKGTEG